MNAGIITKCTCKHFTCMLSVFCADQKNLDDEISKLRKDLKPKVSKLHELEGWLSCLHPVQESALTCRWSIEIRSINASLGEWRKHYYNIIDLRFTPLCRPNLSKTNIWLEKQLNQKKGGSLGTKRLHDSVTQCWHFVGTRHHLKHRLELTCNVLKRRK